MALCAVTLGLVVASSEVSAASGFLEARNVETRIYSDGFSQTAAIVKADRVFTDNRRLGFFRVKLLPLLVVQGVRLEITQSTPNTNWSAGFRARVAPFARNRAIEWRDVSVSLTQDVAPRLQAAHLLLATGPAAEFYVLEDLTLQTTAGPLKVPRARLMLKGLPGTVMWESEEGTVQWNLFTCSLSSEKHKTNQPEKP